MKRTILFVLLILLLSCAAAQAQTATTAPPATPVPLTPDHIATGTISRVDDVAMYHFEIPATIDMVVHYAASGLVFTHSCPETVGAARCPAGGYGGDGPTDIPVSDTIYFPSSNAVQTIQFEIVRPVNSAITYELDLSSVTPTDLALDERRSLTEIISLRSFILHVDPAQPFLVEIEDARTNGDFLWVAHQPFDNTSFKPTAERQAVPRRIDLANRDYNPAGVELLELYYLGGDEFRVLMIANGALQINTSALNVQTPTAGTALTLTLSYHNPLALVRLDAQRGVPIRIDAQVEQGKGALLYVYSDTGGLIVSKGLGIRDSQGSLWPLATTVQGTAEGDQPLYAMVQIANGSTRAPIQVTIQWAVAA